MRAIWVIAALFACAACARANPGGDDGLPDVDAATPDSTGACSGADGEDCDAYYVAPTGDDAAAGTRSAPLKTIGAAVMKAASAMNGRPVRVQAGTYSESFTMAAGIDVTGGYNASWVRDGAGETIVTGPSPVVRFDGAAFPTVLEELTVSASDAAAPGASSIAIVVEGSTMVELRDVQVTAGLGAAGAAGAAGITGPAGGMGEPGEPGCEESGGLCAGCTRPAGGDGGGSSCNRVGGAGGQPGRSEDGGLPGLSGVQDGAPGPGAIGESESGTVGGNGSPGGAGGDGVGGSAMGTFTGAMYLPASGTDGENGGDGNGGGGGGGGGGGTTGCDSYGSSGGGGGGGGCGGTRGFGGGGGGGSFGVIVVDSTVVIARSMIATSRGGAGGTGGSGGTGGAGGPGGAGGAYGGSNEQDDGGFGAKGGDGGAGGRGGHGGGGGGGPSAPLVCVGASAVSVPETMLSPGSGGAGGNSLASVGQPGAAAATLGCSL